MFNFKKVTYSILGSALLGSIIVFAACDSKDNDPGTPIAQDSQFTR